MIAHAFKMIRWQAQRLEPVHEFGREHLALAVKRIAAHPCALTTLQRKRADVVELFAQFTLVDQFGKGHVFGAVDEREADLRIRFVAENRLAHQQLIEIRVDEGPDDRVDLPFVVPDAGGDVDHGVSFGQLSGCAPALALPASGRTALRLCRFVRGQRSGSFNRAKRRRLPSLRLRRRGTRPDQWHGTDLSRPLWRNPVSRRPRRKNGHKNLSPIQPK